MTVCLRAAGPADLEVLVALFRASVHRSAAADYTPAQLAAWAPAEIDRAAWAARLAAGRCWLAERDGAAAGFALLAPADHVDMLFVHPDHLRRGVARLLLAEAEAAARAAGAVRLTTEASLTARPVFERAGFSVLARQTVRRNGQDFVNFRMEKRLG